MRSCAGARASEDKATSRTGSDGRMRSPEGRTGTTLGPLRSEWKRERLREPWSAARKRTGAPLRGAKKNGVRAALLRSDASARRERGVRTRARLWIALAALAPLALVAVTLVQPTASVA